MSFINYSLHVIIDFTKYIFHRNDLQTTLQVFTCAITPDGLKMVSGSYDNTLKVWDIESGSQLLAMKDHTYWVIILLFFCIITKNIITTHSVTSFHVLSHQMVSRWCLGHLMAYLKCGILSLGVNCWLWAVLQG